MQINWVRKEIPTCANLSLIVFIQIVLWENWVSFSGAICFAYGNSDWNSSGIFKEFQKGLHMYILTFAKKKSYVLWDNVIKITDQEFLLKKAYGNRILQ